MEIYMSFNLYPLRKYTFGLMPVVDALKVGRDLLFIIHKNPN